MAMVTSIEATLELWASPLREVKGRMRSLFTQDRVHDWAYLELADLDGPSPAKTYPAFGHAAS